MDKLPDSVFVLYKGKVRVEFWENPYHIYKVDGDRKIGVTTFIGVIDKSQQLISWAVGLMRDELYKMAEAGKEIKVEHIEKASVLHREKKNEAADIGTVAMEWIEYYIKDKLGIAKQKPLPENKEALIAINAFLDWESSNKVKFVSTERVVYSKKYDYVGTLDIEARVNGKLCLIDIKTGNALYAPVRLQTAAYLKADEEESGKSYDGRWAIRLAKETEKEFKARMKKKGKDTDGYVSFEAMYLDEDEKALDRDFKGFLACIQLKNWLKVAEPEFKK